MKWLADLARVFRPASADVLAQQELEDANRQLLTAHSGREYAEAMVTYHSARVARLEARNELL